VSFIQLSALVGQKKAIDFKNARWKTEIKWNYRICLLFPKETI